MKFGCKKICFQTCAIKKLSIWTGSSIRQRTLWHIEIFVICTVLRSRWVMHSNNSTCWTIFDGLHSNCLSFWRNSNIVYPECNLHTIRLYSWYRIFTFLQNERQVEWKRHHVEMYWILQEFGKKWLIYRQMSQTHWFCVA